MDCPRIVAITVVALPLAVSLALAVDSTEGLAETAISDASNVRVYRGIEGHPNYRPSGRSGKRVFRGKPNDPPMTPTAPRRNVTKQASSVKLVPRNEFLAAPGARVPYPYWPPWRQTDIPTHCAPRWMC
jgi:hypothetical protein